MLRDVMLCYVTFCYVTYAQTNEELKRKDENGHGGVAKQRTQGGDTRVLQECYAMLPLHVFLLVKEITVHVLRSK
jgi:hypothetical protein